MNDEMREAFEAQYPTELDKNALKLDNKGEYALMQTYSAWRSFQDGFQAAYQLQQKRIDELEERLRKITQPNIKDLNIELIGLKS